MDQFRKKNPVYLDVNHNHKSDFVLGPKCTSRILLIEYSVAVLLMQSACR